MNRVLQRFWSSLPEKRTVQHFFEQLPNRLVDGFIGFGCLLLYALALALLGASLPFFLPPVLLWWARAEKRVGWVGMSVLTPPCVAVFVGSWTCVLLLLVGA